ncbi:MAG: right-handed parallel beta-helix repeat-containing protein [Bacteroidales bacterium]|nr:right-handed parallel beta-helix repeat-containing protein [Bacteroidales bacterium]
MKTPIASSKAIILILLLFQLSLNANTQTVITASGTINESTTWDADTVKVTGDVIIAKKALLTIMPGTVVEFQGYFGIRGLDNSRLDASGTPGDTIYFTMHDTAGFWNPDTTLGGWAGIRPDFGTLNYCKIQYVKAPSADTWTRGYLGAITTSQTHSHSLFISNTIIKDLHAHGIFSPGHIYFTISKCIIENAKGNGIIGGVNADSCIIRNNAGAGIASSMGAGIKKLINCLIESNNGGGIRCNSIGGDIIGNTIQNNGNDGIYITPEAFLIFGQIKNNVIRNNLGHGISLWYSNNFPIVNNLIYNNKGRGISVFGYSSQLINNTIVNNSSYGIWVRDSKPSVSNCIITGNGKKGDFQISGYNRDLEVDTSFPGNICHCNIENILKTPVTGTLADNIDADPLFINSGNFNFRLQNNSPCINTGTADTTGMHLPSYDLDGNPRICGGRVDMGAYESHVLTGCVDQVFTGDSGAISDQSFDQDYENNAECFKTIIVEEGKRIVHEFTEFDTEKGYDWVYIYDGEYPAGPTLGAFSGNTIPGKVFSSGNKMLIVFRTDESITKAGWTADYRAVCPCIDEIFTADSGFIRSNPEGQDYLAYENCEKRIIAEKGKRIILEFKQFELGSNYDCLVIYDSLHAYWLPLAVYSLHHKLPITHESTGNEVLIHFITLDRGTQGSGWSTKYRTVQTCCDEILTSNSGTIESNADGTEYLNNEDCVKKIITDEGKQIILEFEKFDLEEEYDWIRVYDGNYSSSPLIGTYTGNILPENIKSSGNVLYIHFHSDNSVTKSGWKAGYSVDAPDKSTEKPGDEISLSDQNVTVYPNPASNDLIILFENAVKKASIVLYNIQGQIIYSTDKYPMNKKLILDFSEYENGVYFIKIKTEDYAIEKKMILID